MNDLTRYICASVYSDWNLRNQVINIYESEFKIIIESYGIDTEKVIKHCYRAKSMNSTKNILLFLVSIFLLFPLAFLISFIYRIYLENTVYRRDLSAANFASNTFSPSIGKKLHGKDRQVSKNIIYYDGFSPFVGSGFKIGGWSFAIDIDKPNKPGATPQDFNVSEIYEVVQKELEKLNFKNLRIHERLVVNGGSIRENNKLLPNKLGFPLDEITDSELKMFMNIHNKNARFYQLIQVIDWEGELVLSIYLRLFKNDKNLFVESTYYILPPFKSAYKHLKSMNPSMSFKDYSRLFSLSILTFIFEMIGSVIFVFGRIGEFIHKIIYGRDAKSREQYLQAKKNPEFNYGARYSIRELVSGEEYQQYFQVLDKDMYLKIIEKRMLNTLTNFLEKKNINVAEFKERETQILNNGIIITGGKFKADNVAVGKKSKISTTISNAIKSSGISPDS